MKKIIILIPVYNDWQSLEKLIEDINLKVKNINCKFSIFVINDASTEEYYDKRFSTEEIKVEVISLLKNVGHARSIATGLKYIYEKKDFDYVIPMDGDGEDRPDEINKFIESTDYYVDKAIVGERIKRSESLLFKTCYQIHKLITLVFTGQSIKFGNFTCLPKTTVDKMVNEKATWNSFSGSLRKLEKDLIPIPSIRGTRYFGPSKMNFSSLVKHSLSIISVFRKAVLIRSALFIIIYILLIKNHASIITLIPFLFLLYLVYSVSNLALRENMDEFNNSLKNILDITKLK